MRSTGSAILSHQTPAGPASAALTAAPPAATALDGLNCSCCSFIIIKELLVQIYINPGMHAG